MLLLFSLFNCCCFVLSGITSRNDATHISVVGLQIIHRSSSFCPLVHPANASHRAEWPKPLHPLRQLWSWLLLASAKTMELFGKCLQCVLFTHCVNTCKYISSSNIFTFHFPSLTAKTLSTDYVHRGVSKNRGNPKWMVYNGKPY